MSNYDTDTQELNNFRRELLKIGIVSFREQETLFQIAKRCTKMGIPTAGAGMVIGSAFPVVGTAVGTLVGMLAGTISCTMLNASMRSELRKLANEQ